MPGHQGQVPFPSHGTKRGRGCGDIPHWSSLPFYWDLSLGALWDPQCTCSSWLASPKSRCICLTWGGSDFKIQIPPIRAGCGLGSELGQGIGSFILHGAFLFPPCIFLGANRSLPGQTTACARGPVGITHDVRHGHNAAAWLRAPLSLCGPCTRS